MAILSCFQDFFYSLNEKIVSDLAFELKFNVPPVLLYDRKSRELDEEEFCCISLLMFPEYYEWGLIFDIPKFLPIVQQIIRGSLAQYSETFALDLLIGQTDRNNNRNVVLGAHPTEPSVNRFLFLDHAFTLNCRNRWVNNNWQNIEMVAIPTVFKDCLDKKLILSGVEKIEKLPEQTITEIVLRIPDNYMPRNEKEIVVTGLNGRKQLLRKFVESNF